VEDETFTADRAPVPPSHRTDSELGQSTAPAQPPRIGQCSDARRVAGHIELSEPVVGASRRPSAVPDIDGLRAAASRPTTGCVIDAADVRGKGLEERSKLTADVLVGDEPVVVDHRVGDGYLCAGLFDDLGGGVAEDRAQ
jgi:hypothetical protein